MLSVYLGGVLGVWRDKVKAVRSSDMQIFDPVVAGFHNLEEGEQYELLAKEFYTIDTSDIIIFYLDTSDGGKSARLKLGDAVGRGKQVIVCLDGEVEGAEFIHRYCDYRGVTVCNGLNELISTVKEFVEQTLMVAPV